MVNDAAFISSSLMSPSFILFRVFGKFLNTSNAKAPKGDYHKAVVGELIDREVNTAEASDHIGKHYQYHYGER